MTPQRQQDRRKCAKCGRDRTLTYDTRLCHECDQEEREQTYRGCPSYNTVRDEDGTTHPCGYENRLYCGQCCAG
jgi:hypothetical protein